MSIVRVDFSVNDFTVKNHLALPNTLLEAIDDDSFSLAIDCISLAVIEITSCCENRKLHPSIQRVVDLANSYTEYVPRSDGVRIIGYSEGSSLSIDSVLEAGCPRDSDRMSLSIYRRCDRWIDITGIALIERPLAHIDSAIDGLLTRSRNYIYLP